MTVILRGGWLLVHIRVSKRAAISIQEVEVIKINTNDEYDIHDCPLPLLMKRYVGTKAVEVLGLHQKGHDQRGRGSSLCHGVALYQEHRYDAKETSCVSV